MPNYKVIDADKFDSDLTMLADGIRAKLNNKTPLRFPDEMAEAIRTRGATFIPKTITENGEYNAESEGVDGYSPITVNVREKLEGFFDNSLTELYLPNIRTIKSNALNGDTKITKVTAPRVLWIESAAFYKSNLVTLDAPSLMTIGLAAFADSKFNCEGKLPDKIIRIDENAFSGASDMVLNSLPERLGYIGPAAFRNATKVTLNSLPEGLYYIGERAFYGCTKVQVPEFPKDILTIGSEAFERSPQTITFKGIPYTDGISSTAFSRAKDYIRTINVPWSRNWVWYAPWGATNATINYDVFGDGTSLVSTRWRFNERLPYEARELFYDYSGDGENDYWRIEMPFIANGVEYSGLGWDGGLYYFDADLEMHWVTDLFYEEDEEGNEIEYHGFIDEADREIVIDSSVDWQDVITINEYFGDSIPTFFFYEWFHKYATKL